MRKTRYLFFGLLCVVSLTLMLAACGGDPSEKLHGAWKSTTVNEASGKPTVVLLSKDTLNIDGKTTSIVYKSIALNVDVADAASQASLFLATNMEKDSVNFSGGPFEGKVKFTRISEEEAKALLAQ